MKDSIDRLLEEIIRGLNQKSANSGYQEYKTSELRIVNALKDLVIVEEVQKEYLKLAEQYAKVAKIAYESGELEKSRYFKNESISVLLEGMKRLGYKIERAT